MRSQRQYIRDVLEAMEAAESFVENVRFTWKATLKSNSPSSGRSR